MIDRPTLEQCRAWRDALCGEWNQEEGFDARQEEQENLYFQNFELVQPEGTLAVKTGSAPADCDGAIDAIVPPSVQVHVRPARGTERWRKDADRKTRWGKALIHQWRRPRDVIRLLAGDEVIRDVAVARLLVDDQALQKARPEREEDYELEETTDEELAEDEDPVQTAIDLWEIRHRRKCPFVLERRNPRHCRWRVDERTGEILVMVESYETTALEARVAYGHYDAAKLVLKDKNEPNAMVSVDDIWIGPYRCLLLDNKPLFPVNDGVAPHLYPRIPYFLAPFRELPFDEPGRRYRGMLTNGRQLYPIESQALSMVMQMVALNAWRTYIGWFADKRQVRIVPGEVIEVDKRRGEYLEMLDGEPFPQQMLEITSLVDGYIQRNGVTAGTRKAGETRSAQQVWALQSVQLSKVEPAKLALQELMREALVLSLEILEGMLTESVILPVPGKDHDGQWLGEVSLGPNDVKGYYDGYEISFARRLDPAMLEQAKVLMNLAQNNWMPLRTSWEYSGLTDTPQDWEDELYLQSAERLPFIIKYYSYLRLLAFHEGDEEHWAVQAFRKELEQEAQQEEAPPGGPGIPNPGGMQPPGGMRAQQLGQKLAQGTAPHKAPPRQGRPPGGKRPPNTPMNGPGY